MILITRKSLTTLTIACSTFFSSSFAMYTHLQDRIDERSNATPILSNASPICSCNGIEQSKLYFIISEINADKSTKIEEYRKECKRLIQKNEFGNGELEKLTKDSILDFKQYLKSLETHPTLFNEAICKSLLNNFYWAVTNIKNEEFNKINPTHEIPNRFHRDSI